MSVKRLLQVPVEREDRAQALLKKGCRLKTSN